MKHKIIIALVCLGMISPSFADHYNHYHRHVRYNHYRYVEQPRGDMAFALGIGALAGGLAVAAAARSGHAALPYGDECREVVVHRNCHYNRWGEYHCRRVRNIHYRC